MRHARWQAMGLFLTLLALLGLPGFGAREDDRRWTQFSVADGLPGKTVWAIAVNPHQGDVWLGTNRGASVYRDGHWYSYTRAQGLATDWVAALAIDSRQRVWFGTFGGGLTVLEGGRWQSYTAANSGLTSDWISALATDSQGRVWCGTWGQGVSVLDGGAWQTFSSANSPLPADYVTALAAGPDGALWVGLHGQGLARLAGGRWNTYTTQQGLADDFVNALAVDPDGRLWVGTGKGLTCLDAQGRVVRTYTTADGLPDDRVQALALDGDKGLWVGTAQGAAWLEGERWTVYRGHTTLAHDYVSAIAVAPEAVWFGSLSAGVARFGAGTVALARRLPVVLVHGWHGPESDRLEDSEFRFLASWLREDGYPVYYATDISPRNTLHKNAANLRKAIDRARRESGATQVDVIAFSMGGLNTRSYVESALYAGDVAQVFILGTPQAGVRTWYPFLMREIHEWSRDPSTFELTPEYAALFNDLHRKPPQVPYTLIAGSADDPQLPEIIRGLPAGDALISAGSALALDGPGVHKILTDDLHAWSSETILLALPSLLYPRRTYDAYIRNQLRLGPGVQLPGVEQGAVVAPPLPEAPVHSPFYSGEATAGRPLTQTVPVDTGGEVRFYLRSQGGALTFSLIDPNGRKIDAQTIGERGEYLDLGLADVRAYLIRQAQPGPWQVVVGRPEGAVGGVRFTGFAALSSPLRLSIAPVGGRFPSAGAPVFQLEEPVTITATLRQDDQPVPRARLEAEIGRPDAKVDRLTLFDDGEHADGDPHDGTYGAIYRPPRLGGYYTLFVTAQGTWGGTAFARTAERLFAVSPGTATLTGTYAEAGDDANRDGRLDALALQVGLDVRVSGDFLLTATLLDGQGRELARVVEPRTLGAGPQTATLRFPAYALAQARVDGPYTIGRVMLLDEAGAAIPLQEAIDVLKTRPYRYQDFEGS